MKKEIADRWVSALRSGDYAQGIGYLNNAGNYCCLGVLCEIVKEEINLPVSDHRLVEYGKVGNVAVLPPEVVYFTEMRTDDGFLSNGLTLAGMNDKGMNFNKIADVIEENYQYL